MIRNRNLILPAILIAVGVLALLVNLGAIPTDRLYRLADLWPALLIVLGLVLVINRARFPPNVEMTAAAIVVLIAVVGAGVYVAVGPAISTGTQHLTMKEPAGALKDATLELNVGESTLNLQGSNSLASDLFQAQITYSGPEPTLTFDQNTGRVVISQNGQFGFFGHQSFSMDVQLNTAVRWTFVFHTGASHDTIDASMPLASMEIDTGASTEDISLGAPQGQVPIRINGGALTVHLHRQGGAAASVKVSGGAVSLTFDGDRSSAVGSIFHSTADAPDMFKISVNGGSCTVTMDTGSGQQ